MSSICPKCGKFMEGDVCDFCQNPIETKEFLEKKKMREQFSILKKKLVLSAGIIGAIVVVVAVLLIITNISSNNDSSSNNYHKNETYNSYETYETYADTDESEEANNESSVVSAETIIERLNNNIESNFAALPQIELDTMHFSFDRKEFVSSYNFNSYEYVVPSEIMWATVFEDADTGNTVFGSIAIDSTFANNNDSAKVFINFCYYFANSFDTTLSEDDFLDYVWGGMRNDAEKTTIYGEYMYRLSEDNGSLLFNVKLVD